MNEAARQELMLRLLNENKMLHTTYLTKLCKVSSETIRRDLIYLEEKGLLKRVYGGAVVDSQRGQEIAFSHRETMNIEEKRAIGAAAAGLINDGETIALNSGTTNMEVARNLIPKRNMTFITNCFYVATILRQNKSARIFFVGGELRDCELSTSGQPSHEFLTRLRVDKAVLGIGGIDDRYGITDYHVEESYVAYDMAKVAKKVIVVADYSKFGVCSMNLICDCKNIDYAVTDWNISSKELIKYKQLGIEIINASKI